MKAWANLSRYNPEFTFKTWIARITVIIVLILITKAGELQPGTMKKWKITTDENNPEDAALTPKDEMI